MEKTTFNIYDIMATTKDDETGTLTCQLGNAITAQVVTEGAEFWFPPGFAARPSDVQTKPDDSAQAIAISRSDQDMVIATRDVRSQDIYGALKPGETCLYAPGSDTKGQARILLKTDGGINLYTTQANAEGSQGMGIFINAMNNTISILNASGAGIIIGDDGIQIVSKGGAAGFKVADKIELSGNVTAGNMKVLGGLSVGSGGLTVIGPTTLTAPASCVSTLQVAAMLTATTATVATIALASPPIVAGTPMIVP